jgi:magnesium transporter
VSILILISGVVLLTHKKPEPGTVKSGTVSSSVPLARVRKRNVRPASIAKGDHDSDDERPFEEHGNGEEQTLWGVGDTSDDDGEDEDIDHHQHPLQSQRRNTASRSTSRFEGHGEEGHGLMNGDGVLHDDAENQNQVLQDRERSTKTTFKDDDEEFGGWTRAQ